MSDLDFLLRKAIKSGLNYLSLSPNYANPKAGKWAAAYRHTENANCEYVDHDDPVEALEKAIRAGESEAKRRRQHREDVEIPLAASIEKTQRANRAKAAEAEKASDKARAQRRREAEDLA